MIKKGFSMIELLQTIIVIGIIASLTVNFLSHLGDDKKLYYSTYNVLKIAAKSAVLDMCESFPKTLSSTEMPCEDMDGNFAPELPKLHENIGGNGNEDGENLDFCSRLGNYLNHISIKEKIAGLNDELITPNCSVSSYQKTPDRPNYILSNGVRIYGLDRIVTDGFDGDFDGDSDSMVIYVDVDRKPKVDRLNEDILCYRLTKGGELYTMDVCPQPTY